MGIPAEVFCVSQSYTSFHSGTGSEEEAMYLRRKERFYEDGVLILSFQK